MRNRKAQEEIIGFVAIIVIVSIIGIVLLAFLLRTEPNLDKDSRDISRFLESSMQYTTECALDFGTNHKTISDLIKECYDEPDRACTDGVNVCNALNETMEGLLIAGYGDVSESTYIRSYTFQSSFSKNTSSGIESLDIIKIEKGRCNGNIRGYTLTVSHYPGKIDNSLRLCINQ